MVEACSQLIQIRIVTRVPIKESLDPPSERRATTTTVTRLSHRNRATKR